MTQLMNGLMVENVLKNFSFLAIGEERFTTSLDVGKSGGSPQKYGIIN